MTERIVLVNGPAGVGKTPIARALAATVPNGVCVHGDSLKAFVVTRREGAVEQGLAYVGGAALADVHLSAGYELVAFDYVFEEPARTWPASSRRRGPMRRSPSSRCGRSSRW